MRHSLDLQPKRNTSAQPLSNCTQFSLGVVFLAVLLGSGFYLHRLSWDQQDMVDQKVFYVRVSDLWHGTESSINIFRYIHTITHIHAFLDVFTIHLAAVLTCAVCISEQRCRWTFKAWLLEYLMKRPPSSSLWNICFAVNKNLQSADLRLKCTVTASPEFLQVKEFLTQAGKVRSLRPWLRTKWANCIHLYTVHSGKFQN